jgi:DNA-binding LacI/PurR family transcriptional regulator
MVWRVVQHLLDLGHERIAFLSRPILHLSTIAARWRGYQDTMRAAGLAPLEPWLVGLPGQELTMSVALGHGSSAHSQDVEEILQGLGVKPRPTAVFAINDVMAVVLLKAARASGLEVPRDLSLVGFDDVPIITSLFDVPLTTVTQDAQAMGKRAAELLFERIQGYNAPGRRELLPTRLKVRASTAPPAGLRIEGGG